MDVDLQSLEKIQFSSRERAIFNILKATLEYPANSQAKSELLVEDIIFFCEPVEDGVEPVNILWELWAVIIDIASCIPPGHSWQESLVQSLNSLRQRNSTVPGESRPWKDLPTLSMSVRKHWNDATDVGEQLSDEEIKKYSEESIEDFKKWENLNSFMAGLTSKTFAPWLNLPIWQLRSALEETPKKQKSLMACRLWVATEWILQCADVIFLEISEKKELDKSAARALATGSLCDNDNLPPPLSVERWNFWKQRFSEIAANAENLRLDSSITGRISQALKRMNEVTQT